MIYKVSLVVPGLDRGGAIISLQEKPAVGDHLQVDDVEVEIMEVVDLLPPRGNFHFLHATAKLIKHPPIP